MERLGDMCVVVCGVPPASCMCVERLVDMLLKVYNPVAVVAMDNDQ